LAVLVTCIPGRAFDALEAQLDAAVDLEDHLARQLVRQQPQHIRSLHVPSDSVSVGQEPILNDAWLHIQQKACALAYNDGWIALVEVARHKLHLLLLSLKLLPLAVHSVERSLELAVHGTAIIICEQAIGKRCFHSNRDIIFS
jgi:hypothetical protein